MIDLVFKNPDLHKVRQELLLESSRESAAILLATPVARTDGVRLLVREVYFPTEADYVHRTGTRVQLTQEFSMSVERRAKDKGWSLIYCHSHPMQSQPEYSMVDDAAERQLGPYMDYRSPGVPHLSLLIGNSGIDARVMTTREKVRVLEIGEELHFACNTGEAVLLEDQHNRQVLALGEEGQKRLHSLRVGIIGLGGTGSALVYQLSRLGLDSYILVDWDVVDETNLNRAYGATKDDAGKTKLSIAERVIREVRPNPKIESIRADVNYRGVGRRLVDADIIFCCTDSHASRDQLNRIAYKYMIPVIDMGVVIEKKEEAQLVYNAQASMIGPGLPCYWCMGSLNAERIRRELMTPEQRQADPYFTNANSVKQPAVISLTSTAASLAVTMALAAIIGIPHKGRYVYYYGANANMRPSKFVQNTKCPFCSPDVVGNGDYGDKLHEVEHEGE